MLRRLGPARGGTSPGQPSDLRDVNAHRLVAGLRELGPASRPELARHLGLSAVTIASIAHDLVRAGVLVEAGTRGQRVGRRAVVLDVASDAGAVFVSDIRLDDVRWRRLGLRGEAVDEGSFAMPPDAESLILRLAAVAKSGSGTGRLQVVVGVPATVQADGIVRYWGRPGMLHGVALAERLSDRLDGAAVLTVNDLNLAAVGEQRAGAASAWSRFVYIGVRATGVGMGLVLDRHLYQGANGRAGEIGNLRLSGDGTPLDTRFTRISTEALAELAKVLAVTFAVLDLDGVVVHSEIERGFDWFSVLADHLEALVPFPISLVRSELQDDAVITGAAIVGLDAVWPALATTTAA
jgi:predicted NBD/HSP70 family sugar kinase